jgi:hypothetical protein
MYIRANNRNSIIIVYPLFTPHHSIVHQVLIPDSNRILDEKEALTETRNFPAAAAKIILSKHFSNQIAGKCICIWYI